MRVSFYNVIVYNNFLQNSKMPYFLRVLIETNSTMSILSRIGVFIMSFIQLKSLL